MGDDEIEKVERKSHLWYLRYPLEDGSGHVVVATTRPETMLGDTAVAVHPDDERYRDAVGHDLLLPLMNRAIAVVADEAVDSSFGTGAVKVTPAHDPTDFDLGQRQQRRPQVLAGPAIGEALAFAEGVQHPLPDLRPVQPDATGSPLASLDQRPSSGAVDLEAQPGGPRPDLLVDGGVGVPEPPLGRGDGDHPDDASDEQREAFLSVIPLKRGCSPEEIAHTVSFLASEKSDYITGQVINVDGGMIM